MTSNIQDIISKIQALFNKTVSNGCTEEESLTAIKMIGKLMEKYNISMDDIELKREACEHKKVVLNSKHDLGIGYVAVALGKLNNCKIWVERTRNGLCYNYFGQKTDCLIYSYMFYLLHRSVNNAIVEFKNSDVYIYSKSRRGAYSSFIKGMCIRLYYRILDLVNDNKNQYTSNGKSVMVIKNAIVEEEFAKLNLKLKRSHTKVNVSNHQAYYSGQVAANNVSINKGISSNNNYQEMVLLG